ncbi:ATP-binding protein [Candidatus Methanodesulfokora washburnensis]|uniref:ATP-binding protein n=1 Tax=Candidatus Methanodesulfokora washburnensis TaxID=2478471 RepID=A0A3R9R2L9_9CREN|nr:ATP-binding protein [Candidatus Methanodesulfokores washburnensis]RSN73480.1 ATP-binding protein [Candidatus Methanodesulfokores washburnensis]
MKAAVIISLLLFLRFRSLYILFIPVSLILISELIDSDAIILKEWRNGRISYTLGFYSFRNRRKANENVLIVGTSGKGKTNLMDLLISKYFDRFIVFNFKKGDLHLKLDAKVVDISEYGPFDKDSFVEAFMLTFQPRIIGEVVSRYAGLLIDLVNRSEDWATLLRNLDESIKREKDRINKTTLISLKEKIHLLLPKGTGDIPIADRVVYDFSSLNDYQKCFFAEILLRKLRDVSNIAIGIDEAYNVFRRTEHHYSITEDLLRGGRARKVAFIVATQSILDMPAPLISQFDTIYVFSVSGPDLERVRAMGVPEGLIKSLRNYECIEIRSGYRVLRFRRFKKKEKGEREEREGEKEKAIIEYDGRGFNIGKCRLEMRNAGDLTEIVFSDGTRTERCYVKRLDEIRESRIWKIIENRFSNADEVIDRIKEVDLRRGIDYRDEITNALAENGILSSSAIARIIARRHGLNEDSVKFACSTYLKRMAEKGEIVRNELLDEFGRRTVYYELPSASESRFHDLIIKKIEIICKRLGLNAERRENVDIAIGNIGIEVETGKKSRKPAERRGYDEIIVVVPNEDVKKRYEGSLTLKELFIRLKGSDKWVRGSIEAYLEGKRDIKWLIGVIERSGLRGEGLRKEMERMKEGNEEKVKIIEEECRRRGYI